MLGWVENVVGVEYVVWDLKVLVFFKPGMDSLVEIYVPLVAQSALVPSKYLLMLG